VSYFFKAANTSQVTCNVEGYFGYSAYTPAGNLITAKDDRTGLTATEQPYKPGPIILEPGGTVWTDAQAGDNAGGGETCNNIASWHLIPPNTTATTVVKADGYFCNGLRVDAVSSTRPQGI
jgi:hypothetical protein